MEDVTFKPAQPGDLPAIKQLLDRCALPSSDLGEAHLKDFLIGHSAEGIVGTVGLDRAGDVALLRSLAVLPGMQKRGIGHRLWELARERARTLGVARLYLLTTTASGLFERWGFAHVSRDDMPVRLRATPEFTTLCPSSAVVMALELG